MIDVGAWTRKSFSLVGDLLLVPVGLLALVLLAVFARPLFVIGVLAIVLGVVLSIFSPRFRHWLDAKINEPADYKGLRLGRGVAFCPSHSWARIKPRHVLVGADDLVQAALGPVQAVDLPPVGKRFERGDPLFVLRRGERSVEARAPLAGTVLARNETLLKRPGLVNEDPFNKGWVVRLQAESLAEGRQHLFEGEKADRWFGREIDRLMNSLHADEHVATCLADGGAVVEDLYRHIDDDAWKRLTDTFFVPKT
jgi:glycine cleavage system H lipoate-binding protein